MEFFPFPASVLSIVSITMELNELTWEFAHAQRRETLPSNVTEMDATIESDTSQNTNSLISSGYFIENYPENDSDKENNSTNNIDATLESSEDKVKTLAQRTNGLTFVPFLSRTISLDYEDTFFVYWVFLYFIVIVCFFVMVLYPLFNYPYMSDRVHCHLVYIVLFSFYKIWYHQWRLWSAL